MRSGHRNRALPALLLLTLVLTGCWDRREIEEKSTVLASGVDLCDEGQGCNLITTRQFAIPGRIPLEPGSGESGAGAAVQVISTPGVDGPDTARRAQAELNRVLSFGHIRLMVFSEDMARSSPEGFIDYVRRHPESRRLMWVAVAEGRAEELLRARPSLDRVPALFLNDMFADSVKEGRMPRVFWGDFLVRLSNEGEDAVAPLVRMAGPDQPQLAGLAVFRGARMVGKLTPEETATYMQVQGVQRGSEVMHIGLPGGRQADVKVYGRGASYQIARVRGRIDVRITMELETQLVHLSHELRSSDAEVIAQIERETGREVRRRAEALVQKLQREFGADILALGERVRSRLPGVWSSIGDWRAAFADARIRFDVDVHVRRTGMAAD